MTYCVGILLDRGLVMLSDTRTNAGLDNIATFRKMHQFTKPYDRVITMLTAGNLSISQAVINLLEEGLEDPDEPGKIETLFTVPTMFRAAQLVGRAIREVYQTDGKAMEAHDAGFNVSILLGGQVGSGKCRLYQLYSAGNFIEATPETPFLQIGEHKYGKPILDRVIAFDTSIDEAVKAALISMDSTLRSNLSVGLPMDLLTYERDALNVGLYRRIDDGDPYFRTIREKWSEALRNVFVDLDKPEWR